MVFIILSIILCIISILFFIFGVKKNNIIKEYNNSLIEEYENNKAKIDTQENLISLHNNQIACQELELEKIKERVQQRTEDLELLVQESFSNYCKSLEKYYNEVESQHDIKMLELKEDFDRSKEELSQQIEEERNQLIKIQNTKSAILEAQKREQEIKDKIAFYSLNIEEEDLQDIEKLNNLKQHLNKPRILSMLIWQTYYQKPMTNLCNNVLGKDTVCGIYKITNQKNDLCYIGQSKDVSQRFKSHAKCGLGIDTPPGNKLYKAILEDGLFNFTFELLEKCSEEQLDEKEKSYIKLYQSQIYGYNSVSGNGDTDLLGE